MVGLLRTAIVPSSPAPTKRGELHFSFSSYTPALTTAHQLKYDDLVLVRQLMGVVGVRMVHELRGTPYLNLEHAPQPRKSIVSSRSFGQPVQQLEEVLESVSYHAGIGARKLRRQKSLAGVLGVFVHTNGNRPDLPLHNPWASVHLEVPTADTLELTDTAVRLATRQHALFDPVDLMRSRRLMETLVGINDVMGDGTVHLASAGIKKRWKVKADRRSPCWTTRWEELPTAGT